MSYNGEGNDQSCLSRKRSVIHTNTKTRICKLKPASCSVLMSLVESLEGPGISLSLRSATSLAGLLRASTDRARAATEAWRVRFYRKSDGTLNHEMLSPEQDTIFNRYSCFRVLAFCYGCVKGRFSSQESRNGLFCHCPTYRRLSIGGAHSH